MRRTFLLTGLLAFLALGCATTSGLGEGATIRAKNRVVPALVHISPVKEVFSGGKRAEVVVEGSGFIISHDGYVVTNEHVAGETKLVRCVLYNKEELDAEVIGTDRFTDIAVLKLISDRTDYPIVRLGSSDDLEAGQTVLALGSPHGLARSVSKGIVSVTDRYLGEGGSRPALYNTWIQTDAAINPGNSGGPLVNIRGEVIGINTRKMSGADNLGFAIPIDIAKQVVDAIIEHKRVRRSWVGANFQEMTRKTDDPTQRGVVIGDISPLGPAAAAGVQAGDVVTAANGIPVHARFAEDLPAVRKLIADVPVGDELTFTVIRGEEEVVITMTTTEKSNVKGDELEFDEWGFTASQLTPAIVRAARLTSSKGIAVSGAQVGGIAANAGLKQGDIILTVDGQEVENLLGFKDVYDECVASEKRLVLLDVKRGALTRFVLVKQEPEEEADQAEEGEKTEESKKTEETQDGDSSNDK